MSRNKHWKKQQPVIQSPSEYWETGLDKEVEEITECGKVEEPAINISVTALRKMELLMQEYKNDEWAADLIGEIKDGEYWIYDIYVFEQEVTATSVERIEPEGKGVVGVTHSHHTMGAFMSATDDAYPNQNYNLSGVVSRDNGTYKLDMKFSVRVKTPCGCYKRYTIDAWYVIYHYNEFSSKEWLNEVKNKIKKKSYGLPQRTVSPTFSPNWYGTSFDNYSYDNDYDNYFCDDDYVATKDKEEKYKELKHVVKLSIHPEQVTERACLVGKNGGKYQVGYDRAKKLVDEGEYVCKIDQYTYYMSPATFFSELTKKHDEFLHEYIKDGAGEGTETQEVETPPVFVYTEGSKVFFVYSLKVGDDNEQYIIEIQDAYHFEDCVDKICARADKAFTDDELEDAVCDFYDLWSGSNNPLLEK